ncbi:protein kinase domain-containing protein [Sorangium sp. So ce385]|uniref:serine/threonine protein kinase n=1 Tax=Sorangium sp. So ce385 TaxID=3133308 RepID=UPI003F5BF6E4
MNVGPSSTPPDPGHHLLLELGRGGTAQVFLAVQSGAEGVDKLVVLKFLRPDLLDNLEMREMFINEARFSARLNHANIVQTSAIVQTTRGAAIVMEYLEGQSLSIVRSRARTKLPLEMHLRIIIDALRGLHYAHELTGFDGEPLNVVHRDVSPHNVFVTYDGQVKLIDFGIAKLTGGSVETATGVIKGKIGYMPAEQIEGGPIDRRADLYAVGVMLWEAATGERMWKGMTDIAIMHRVLNGELPRPRDVKPDVPEELERIILKALSVAPEQRYATAAELEADLEAFVAGMAPVTNRDIGRFVSREFEDVRAETKRIIGREMMRRGATARASMPVDTLSPPPLDQSLARAGYGTMTGSDTKLTDGQEPAPRPWLKRASRSLLATAVLGIGCGIVLAAATTRSPRSSPVSLDAASLSASPQPSLAPAVVPASGAPSGSGVVAAAAAPAAARSGEPSAGSAEPTIAPAELSETLAEASAKPADRSAKQPRGFAKQPRPSAKQPEPPAKEPAERGDSAAAPADKPTPAAPASTPSANCDPPYTIDAEGIKRFKVECM